MIVYFEGGPWDGKLEEMPDLISPIIRVPVMATAFRGFEQHEYEVVKHFGKMGNKKTAAAVYKGIRGAPDVLIGEHGQQKQETPEAARISTDRGDAGSGVTSVQEPERGLPSPVADKPNRKRADAPGNDGRSPRCRREGRDR